MTSVDAKLLDNAGGYPAETGQVGISVSTAKYKQMLTTIQLITTLILVQLLLDIYPHYLAV